MSASDDRGVPRLVSGGEPTAKMRSLEDTHGIPTRGPEGSHHRGDSGAFAAAAVGVLETVLRDRFQVEISDERIRNAVTPVLEDQFEHMFEKLRRVGDSKTPDEEQDKKPERTTVRLPAGWIVMIMLSSILCTVAVVVTVFSWSRIEHMTYEVEGVRERTKKVEEKADATEQYEMVVANWLVRDAHTDYERAANLDKMLRIIAAKIEADVSEVVPPTESDPPTPVQKKNSLFLFKDSP